MINTVYLAGKISDISDIKQAPQGNYDFISFRVKTWKTVNGKKIETTHNCNAYGTAVSALLENVRNGDLVSVRGENQTQKHTSREGFEGYSTVIAAQRVEKLNPDDF